MLKAEWGLFVFKMIYKYMSAVVTSQDKVLKKAEDKEANANVAYSSTVSSAEKMIADASDKYGKVIDEVIELKDMATKEAEKAKRMMGKLNEFLE